MAHKTTKLPASNVSYTRNFNIEKNRAITLWVDDLNQKRIPLTQHDITAKARSLFNKIQQKKVETRHSIVTKVGRFKQHSQIHCVKISGEAASADIEAARTFTAEFKKIIGDNVFPPDLVF